MLTFEFTGVSGSMTETEKLTSGMVGKQVQIILSQEWAELTKTAVFLAGDICRVTELEDTVATIPEEVLRCPFRKFFLGVCGTNSDGTLVIPTVMAEGPTVEPGADPTADPVAVELPVWKNLQNQIGDLAGLGTSAKEDLVSAINELLHLADTGELDGATFTPSVSGGILSWTNDRELENPDPVDITGPQGPQGETGAAGGFYTPSAELYSTGIMKVTWYASKTSMTSLPPNYIRLPAGKSAYEYAVEGGYSGTEEEFGAKLAELLNA